MYSDIAGLFKRILVSSSANAKRAVLEGSSSSDLEDFGRYMFAHINVYLAEGNVSAAEKLLNSAAALRRVYACTNYEYFFLKGRARVARASGNLKTTQTALVQLLRLLDKESDGVLIEARSEIAMELGLLFDEMGDKPRAERYFRRSYEAAVRGGSVFNQAAALFNLAALCQGERREVEFTRYTAQVIQLSRQHALAPHLARALLLLANQSDFNSETGPARSHYLEALTTYWKLPDMVKVSEILVRAGELAGIMGERSEQMLALYEAMQISRKLDFLEGLTEWTYWAGRICKDLGLEERAFAIFQGGGQMAGSLGIEREKISSALRAHQCAGPGSTEPLWLWLDRQAPPIGTPGAEGIDATGLPLLEYRWSETVSRSARYQMYGGEGAALLPYPSGAPRSPLVSRQRLLYLLVQLGFGDSGYLNDNQKAVLSHEARELDRHMKHN